MKDTKRKLLKIFIVIIFILLFSRIVWAENWYAVSQYDLKAVDETLIRIRVVTRTFDRDRCYEAAGKKMMLSGTEWINHRIPGGIDSQLGFTNYAQ